MCTTPEKIIQFIMDFLKQKPVFLSHWNHRTNCRSLQLENTSFLFAKANQLRMNVLINQLLPQLLKCSALTLPETMMQMSLNIWPVTDGQKRGSDTTWRQYLVRKDRAVGILFSLLISDLKKDGAVHRALVKTLRVTLSKSLVHEPKRRSNASLL